MATNIKGARLGAAAFAIGMSLAGPQALGVAAADDAGSTPQGPATSRSATGPRHPGVSNRPGRAATRSATKANPSASRSPLPDRRAIRAERPVPHERAAAITSAVNTFLTSGEDWLSTKPAGPLNEVLQGALALARRTLAKLPSATTAAPYLTDQQLQVYLLGVAKEQYGGLFGQTVPYYGYSPYNKYVYMAGAPDSAVTSDTNTQVTGVDEADFIENDGSYLYVAQSGQLTIFDSTSAITSQTPLSGNVTGEFLAGDRLTVITSSGAGWYGPMVRMAAPWYWNPQTTVTVFDVSDRSAPTVVTATVFDGGYRDARAVDGTIYLVMDGALKLPEPEYTEFTVQPDDSGALKIRWDPTAPVTYRTYETWESYAARVGPQIATLSLPHAYSVDSDGNLVDLGALLDAENIVLPQAGGQQSLLTVVSVDSQNASAGTHFDDSIGALVYSSGTSVYMAPDALYVASNQDDYTDMGSSTQTRIDRFTVDGTDLGWQAAGVVPGSPINQFAFSEQDGHLQVATHTWSWQWTPSFDGTGSGTWVSQDDNGVYVLDTVGDTLDIVGSLTGLAPGEQLYAARFVGNMAYLVTFVRTDPLFTIDLSDPKSPALQGELVIPGFSNYLQPVGDGLLLGIGQDGQSGTNQVQVSLFDVSDAANPTRTDQQILDENSQWSWSEAQFDHHALLYSPEDGLLVVPVSGSGGQTLEVLTVDASGIQLRGRIQTDGSVIRTARIGDVLYAVSADHVTAYSLDDLAVIDA